MPYKDPEEQKESQRNSKARKSKFYNFVSLEYLHSKDKVKVNITNILTINIINDYILIETIGSSVKVKDNEYNRKQLDLNGS